MSSRRIEVLHEAALSQLLSDSGLECIKPDIASSESSSSHEDSEEQGLPEQHEETTPVSVQENESTATAPSVAEEETPRIFPSPSLRRILPDSTRLIEEQNRIHVLPKEFKSSVDPESIPRISRTSPQKYIDALADIVGCTEYKTSLAEYWFLDTLACLLRRAQADLMDRPTQAVLILWFCEWMREMQRFDAADRQRMMKRFEDNMLSAARFVADKNFLPTPAQAGVHFEEVEVDSQLVAATESKHAVTFEGAAYECSLRDLTKITHYIYDLFGTDYQYELIRSIFTFTPDYIQTDSPYPIRNPKRLYAPIKQKSKKDKSPKRDAKSAGKGKKRDVDTEEYLALMMLKAKEEKELEEQEELDREAWNRKSHILPLLYAADDGFFDKYWPPPPPEPEPIVEPNLKGKAKGKGKK
ncbi:uncharacterized protein LOC101736906 isoform X1 [Bombyx mori]|uniref:Uncharacterized protein n=1 Tax=Bombyx mori TaxID=7091 RepID=A0A8R2HQV0_BOMMO|nr:uncharacterized protein LOC101736906 isoform X1 [Bombyx mori]